MPADTAPIIAAARRRHELTRARAIQAIRELDRTGTAVTFATVAARAGVSRSWLYSQSDIAGQVQRLREATRRAPAPRIPAGHRTSDASLPRRLAAAHEEIRKLRAERDRLRRQIAHALGEQRQARYQPPR